MRLTTAEALADEFGIELEKLHELRRRHNWPHVRLGRFDIRFTDEQIEQIVALHSEKPEKPAAPGRVSLAGQTARSAARRRAG